MLKYQAIHQVQQVRRRMKSGRYGGYYGQDHTLEGDHLFDFTHGPAAEADSLQNLETLLAQARAYDQSLVVIKPYVVQIAGAPHSGHRSMADGLFTAEWIRGYDQWLDTTHRSHPLMDTNERGQVMGFYTYRACMCLEAHQGVYDVVTGQRLTNRRDTIERMWALGFAANRGRPLAIAKPRWTGTREELELITELADRFWERRYETEAAKKMVSTYRSINRYAAWPGAW